MFVGATQKPVCGVVVMPVTVVAVVGRLCAPLVKVVEVALIDQPAPSPVSSSTRRLALAVVVRTPPSVTEPNEIEENGVRPSVPPPQLGIWNMITSPPVPLANARVDVGNVTP